MQTILEILDKTTAYFQSRGVPDAKLDAQLILADALGCKRLELFLRFDEPLAGATLDRCRDFVRRRARREPLQYILGKTDFFGITLKCDARALIPRPETEYLCELLAERFAAAAPQTVLELGAGTGAVSLALKNRFPEARVSGVDISEAALLLARENAAALGLGVEFSQSDWFSNVSGKFDLIVSNPPYLSDSEVESAQPEVRDFEPLNALRSDSDGIADLRKILAAAPRFLNSGGLVACECGIDHPEKLAAEFSQTYKKIEPLKDLNGRPRFVFCQM